VEDCSDESEEEERASEEEEEEEEVEVASAEDDEAATPSHWHVRMLQTLPIGQHTSTSHVSPGSDRRFPQREGDPEGETWPSKKVNPPRKL